MSRKENTQCSERDLPPQQLSAQGWGHPVGELSWGAENVLAFLPPGASLDELILPFQSYPVYLSSQLRFLPLL